MIETQRHFSNVRSDSLRSFVAMAANAKADPQALGLLRQLRLVVDSNIVLESIRWMARRRDATARPALQEVVSAGTLVAYAPEFLEQEVNRKLVELAPKWKLPAQNLQACWSELRQYLSFVPIPDGVAERACDYFELRDPTDADFLAAFQQVNADAILTRDKDIQATAAPTLKEIDILLDVRRYAREKVVELTLIASGALVLHVAAAGLHAAGRAIAALVEMSSRRFSRSRCACSHRRTLCSAACRDLKPSHGGLFCCSELRAAPLKY